MDKVMAIREIKAALALTSSRLSETAAPMAQRSVPASGLPAAMPKLAAPPAVPAGKGVPAGAPPLGVPLSVPAADLDDLSVPAAHPLARDAAPIASAAPVVAGALARFEAVPAR
ncbi:hypothetical protein [Stappia sp. MMSF_3263]|uniref:hypothetical protein n=1 Tax=Stappia sp. MMSF_3263 TaxID=3046693 RepID=UPI00273D9F36|nr:hypothetical protein [Stappia sp. MMSF_3263]